MHQRLLLLIAITMVCNTACMSIRDSNAASEPGMRAVAQLQPLTGPTSGSICSNGVSGTATFTARQDAVDLRLQLDGCDPDVVAGYDVRIEQGASCDDVEVSNVVIDDSISNVWCDTPCGLSTLHYHRPNAESVHWTIDSNTSSGLLDRLLVLYDTRGTRVPVACGRIEQAPPAVQVAATDAPPPVLQALLAGYCPWRLISGGVPDCPDPVEMAQCARERCDIADCYEPCADYLACLQMQEDPCTASLQCDMGASCSACTLPLSRCGLSFCADTVSCAATVTPGGPCSKVEACCMTQGDYAPRCLELLNQVSLLSGDPTCTGLIMDWDWNQGLPVACTYE